MRTENLDQLYKTLVECSGKGATNEEWNVALLTSIAVSLAKIADIMADSEEHEMNAKWQRVLDGAWIYAKCSSCGSLQDVKSNYCPNCGAKMEGSEDGKGI